ncbi:MAG: DUF1844 domain-containing protein [Silvanigrellales bacterium]|jgi:hypothetical protein|nr:DUF1844 domain-containing protein [Silvanigrellales bacterium]
MQEDSLFHLLVLSLGNAALMGLGFVPEPETGRVEKNLDLASHNIDLLSMLQLKTKGNLTPDEAHLIESVLYDLRLKFCDSKRKPDEFGA